VRARLQGQDQLAGAAAARAWWTVAAAACGAADRAQRGGAALAFELAFPVAAALPGAGEGEADPGGGDDLQEAGAAAGAMLGQPCVQGS
jgi:hypothetical protein